MNHSLIKIISTIICIFLLGSCTKSLWIEPKYQESISSFMIDKDMNNFVVLGEEYHYIFPKNDALNLILTHPLKNRIEASFQHFHVNNNQAVTGKVYLTAHVGNVTKDKKELITLGFEERIYKLSPQQLNRLKSEGEDISKYTEPYYTYKINVTGKRYKTSSEMKSSATFNSNYFIDVTEDISLLGKVARTIATPITVAADGTMAIAGVSTIVVVGLTACSVGKVTSTDGDWCSP